MGQVVVAGAKGKTSLEKMHNHYIRTAAMTNASELLIRNLRTSTNIEIYTLPSERSQFNQRRQKYEEQ